MANLNRIILVGRLTADPEARLTVDGLPMTKFRLAVTRPVAGGDNGVDYMDIVTWRRLAEVSGQYLKKGRLVLVEGRIQNRSFEDQSGQRRWVTEVVGSNMTMLDGAKGTGPAEQVVSAMEARESEHAAEHEAEEVVDDIDLEGDLPF